MKRYELYCPIDMGGEFEALSREHDEGDWVRYEEVERLTARAERAEAEMEALLKERNMLRAVAMKHAPSQAASGYAALREEGEQ